MYYVLFCLDNLLTRHLYEHRDRLLHDASIQMIDISAGQFSDNDQNNQSPMSIDRSDHCDLVKQYWHVFHKSNLEKQKSTVRKRMKIFFTWQMIQCHHLKIVLKNNQYEHHPQAAAHCK